jgi:DNA-binding MarR family transcriptional regulator
MPESLGAQLANAVGVLLQRSTRARIYGDLTDDLDAAIDEATYPVISGLARLGTRTAAQIAVDIGIDRSVVSRHAGRLEMHGLLRRRPDPSDGRATLLELTEYGNDQIALMRARLYGEFDEYLASWPSERARTFVEDFMRFVADGPFSAPD